VPSSDFALSLAFSPLTGQDPQLPSAKVVEAKAAIEMAVTAMVRNFFIREYDSQKLTDVQSFSAVLRVEAASCRLSAEVKRRGRLLVEPAGAKRRQIAAAIN
jgi:hypothetical protein